MEYTFHFHTDSHRQVWLGRTRPSRYGRKQKERKRGLCKSVVIPKAQTRQLPQSGMKGWHQT